MLRQLPTPVRFAVALLLGALCAVGFTLIVYGGVLVFQQLPQAGR